MSKYKLRMALSLDQQIRLYLNTKQFLLKLIVYFFMLDFSMFYYIGMYLNVFCV